MLLFGSSVSGLYFPHSDVDLSVTLNHGPHGRAAEQEAIRKISKILRKSMYAFRC